MNGVRIDTRPRNDAAVQAGMRNIHRGMDGQVIGGVTAEGNPIGTKSSKFRSSGVSGSATPRLDAGVQTPRLDSNPAQPIRYTNAAERRAQDVAASRRVAANGGFGIAAQQRETQRQAKTIAQGPPAPVKTTPAAPARPQTAATGAALAKSNIATMGVQGATADYFKRSATEKQQKAGQAWASATTPAPSKPLAPITGKRSSFRQAAGLPQRPEDSAFAKSLIVPTPANVQPIGAGPVTATPAAKPAAPGSDFEALTQPRQAPQPVAATQPAPQPKPASRFRTPVGGPSFTTPEAIQARRQAEVDDYRKSKKKAYDAVWNAQPNLPGADPNSWANKSYKSVRAFASGASY